MKTQEHERRYARERMRAKRQNPEFRRRELAALKAMRRLTHEHPTRYQQLLEEELKQ